jgi:hypothetical protein
VRLAAALVAAFAVMLVGAGASSAAVVDGALYWDDTGEDNHVTLTQVGDQVQITDTATISPGDCDAVDEHTVRCPRRMEFHLDLNGGDDVVNDELPVPTEPNRPWPLVSVDGRAGDDVFNGGPSTDDFRPGTGDDVFHGGGGYDVLGYYSEEPISVSLDSVANDGHAGEHANIFPDVEDVMGTYGDDVFVGGDNRDTFTGYKGDDLMIGGGGSDTLASSDGLVRAFGGPGDDDINVGDVRGHGPPDQVDCGDGVDSAGGEASGQSTDHFATDCESTSINGIPWAGPFRPEWRATPSTGVGERTTLLKTALRVRVACRAKAFPCQGHVVIRRLGTISRAKLGSVEFKLNSSKAKKIRVPLFTSAGLKHGTRLVSTVRLRDARHRRTGTGAELTVH